MGGSGIPFSSSISSCVFPHISLVIENVVGHLVLVCSLQDNMGGPKVRFLEYGCINGKKKVRCGLFRTPFPAKIDNINYSCLINSSSLRILNFHLSCVQYQFIFPYLEALCNVGEK